MGVGAYSIMYCGLTVCIMLILQTVMCKDPPHHWVEVAVSPTGKAIAMVDRNGMMWGGSTDFKV